MSMYNLCVVSILAVDHKPQNALIPTIVKLVGLQKPLEVSKIPLITHENWVIRKLNCQKTKLYNHFLFSVMLH